MARLSPLLVRRGVRIVALQHRISIKGSPGGIVIDYRTADPGFKAIRWSLDDPRRQTFWGPPPPQHWADRRWPRPT
jgi:hypothetical protein